MKIWLIVSAILAFPFFIGNAAICVTIFSDSSLSKNFFGPNIDLSHFLWASMSMALATAVIMSTIIMMVRYVPQVNDFDKATKELNDKKDELNVLIKKYNNLIIDNARSSR